MGQRGRRDDGARGSRLPAMSGDERWEPSSRLENNAAGQRTELPAPPRTPRRRRLWLPAAAGVILVFGFIAIASITSRDSPEEDANPILIPPPGDLRATTRAFSVTLVWQPSDHPDVDGYLVYRGGALLGATEGDTRFVDGEALPGQAYLYSVVARSSHDDRSRASYLKVFTERASIAAGRVSGLFSVKLRLASRRGFSRFAPDVGAEWEFDSRCRSGPCDVVWTYIDYPTVRNTLRWKAGRYRGSDSGRMNIRCGSASVMTNASIRMSVTDADVIGDEWRATELEGSIVERSQPQLGCRGSRITYSFTGSVLPEYADAVLRVQNDACRVEGSGFIVSRRYVVTNAHVVAGDATPVIVERGRRLQADVVAFVARADIAVLRVNDLLGRSMPLASFHIQTRAKTFFLGFPEGGPLTATDATVTRVFDEAGPDVYVLEGPVRHGNSGGPLVLPSGEAVGVIAAEIREYGLAIASTEVIGILERVRDRRAPVTTGSCPS
jgi:Trypsin-like peptidase domain